MVSSPDYYVKQVDREIVYPHSVDKLHGAYDELSHRNPDLRDILFER